MLVENEVNNKGKGNRVVLELFGYFFFQEKKWQAVNSLPKA
jgi:hypothetical protein